MTIIEGGFVWYELMTADAEAAGRFYAAVVGWTMSALETPGQRYILAKIGERSVAGLMDYPPELVDPRPGWVGYILVDDVDRVAERVTQVGGAVYRAANDIPGIGRFAVVADPQGAVVVLFRADGTAPPDLEPGVSGSIGWHELRTRDGEAAFAFYQDLFGWRKAEAVDMGPMGIYQTFSIGAATVGGMMGGATESKPSWLYYVTVEAIDAAVARVAEAGGTLLAGPYQVPSGDWIAHARDPKGATFALTARRR